MTEIHRIRGVAGGGKTTMMLGEPDKSVDGIAADLRQDGYEAEDFVWVSFSRSHAADLKEDVVASWGPVLDTMENDEAEDTLDELEDSVSTLHSLCLTLLNIDYENIICASDDSDADLYEAFWATRGIEFEASETNPLHLVYRDETPDMSRGEKLVTIDQLLTLKGDGYDDGGISLSPHAVKQLPVEINLAADKVVSLIRDWREFKDEQGLVEHHDYIRQAANSPRTPDCSVLMVDEMQDYAPLEYAVIREWVEDGDIDHAVFCGDENQAIYGFKEADPRVLTESPADDEDVLAESYRCAEKVCGLARDVLPESGITSARERRGRVVDASTPTRDDLAGIIRNLLDTHDPLDGEYNPYTPGEEVESPQTVYILCRTNRQVGYVSRALQRAGVPFCGLGDKMDLGRTDEDDDDVVPEYYPWHNDLITIAKALRAAKYRSGRVGYSAAKTVVEYTPNPEERMKMAESPDWGVEMQSASGEDVIDLWTAFPAASNVQDVLNALTVSEIEREMLEGAANSEVELRPARVQVGTIHEAKGREAPATVILDAYPDQLAERYREDAAFRAEEDRLAYVGVTRARETVAIARDFVDASSFAPLESDNIDAYSPRTGVTSDD